MTSPHGNVRADWENDLRRLLEPRAFGRLFIVGLLTKLASLVILGIAFLVIWYGLWHALTRLAIYWAPIYRALAAVEGISLDPSQPTWRLAPVTAWQVPGLVLRLAISLGAITLGVYLLLKMGFCSQNFICLFLGSADLRSP